METEKIIKVLNNKFYYSLFFVLFILGFTLTSYPINYLHSFFLLPDRCVLVPVIAGFAFSFLDLGRSLYLAEEYQKIIKNCTPKKLFDVSDLRGIGTAVCSFIVIMLIDMTMWYKLFLAIVAVAFIYFIINKTRTNDLFKKISVTIDWSMLSDVANHKEKLVVIVPAIPDINQETWVQDFVAKYVRREKLRIEEENQRINNFSKLIKTKIS